jgi:hypothetical protein
VRQAVYTRDIDAQSLTDLRQVTLATGVVFGDGWSAGMAGDRRRRIGYRATLTVPVSPGPPAVGGHSGIL